MVHVACRAQRTFDRVAAPAGFLRTVPGCLAEARVEVALSKVARQKGAVGAATGDARHSP